MILLCRDLFKQVSSDLSNQQFVRNFCFYLIELCKKGTGEDLLKGIYGFLEAVSRQIVEAEETEIEGL